MAELRKSLDKQLPQVSSSEETLVRNEWGPEAWDGGFGDVPRNSISWDLPKAPVPLIADSAMTSSETDPWKIMLFSKTYSFDSLLLSS